LGGLPELAPHARPLSYELSMSQDIKYPPLFDFRQAKCVEMWRSKIREEESRIEVEKRIKYKGTARIRLKWLHFQWNRPRELDGKNVERLKAGFQKDCRRLDEHNHIPVVTDQQSLDTAEELSGVSARQLGKYPQGGYLELVFPVGYQVECLHG